MAKSTWSDEDEKALLCLLQKKGSASNSGYSSGSSIPPPLESQGSMTDGSKRLRDAMADDGFDLKEFSLHPGCQIELGCQILASYFSISLLPLMVMFAYHYHHKAGAPRVSCQGFT